MDVKRANALKLILEKIFGGVVEVMESRQLLPQDISDYRDERGQITDINFLRGVPSILSQLAVNGDAQVLL